MAKSAEKTDPKLWEKVKAEVTKDGKGGKPGQWSARKAQMAVAEYKHEGGGYRGKKDPDNHLLQWEREDWGTKSGERSRDTGERYLPKQARDSLSEAEYRRSTAKKRADTSKGKQFSAQPADVARKTAAVRRGAAPETKQALLEEARRRGIPGRSRMTKDELARALRRA